jgi:hypothetical protein
MKLYFNGCSFTYGDGLKDPASESWPSIVAKKYNLEYLNHAVSGGSNDRIIKGVITNLNNYNKFYIGWTSYSRFVKYNPVDNFEIVFNPQLNMDPTLHYSDDLKTNYQKYKNFGELYYKYWYNELYEFKGWLHQIILLQSLFEFRQKDYVMINMLPSIKPWLSPVDSFIENVKDLICFDKMSDEQIYNEYKEINMLISQVDISKFVFWDYTVYDLVTDNNLTISTHDCHPNISGHNAIARAVLIHDSN